MLVYVCQKLIWLALTPLFKIFLHLRVEGQKNLKLLKEKQFFVIANHLGLLDAFLISSAFPYGRFLRMNFRYMMKPNWFRAYPFVKYLGAYPIYPGQGTLEEILAETEKHVQSGKHLLIFPEGKIPKPGETARPKRGIAYLTKKYNLPIVPVALFGSGCVNGEKGPDWKKIFSRRCRVKIKIGRPFYYEEVASADMDYFSAAEKIMERVRVML